MATLSNYIKFAENNRQLTLDERFILTSSIVSFVGDNFGKPDQDNMLRLYGLFKQVLYGDAKEAEQPSYIFNHVAYVKWSAWKSVSEEVKDKQLEQAKVNKEFVKEDFIKEEYLAQAKQLYATNLQYTNIGPKEVDVKKLKEYIDSKMSQIEKSGAIQTMKFSSVLGKEKISSAEELQRLVTNYSSNNSNNNSTVRSEVNKLKP